jgi:hypothetical protein
LILMVVGAVGFVVSLLYMFVWLIGGPMKGPLAAPTNDRRPRTDLRPAGPARVTASPQRYAHP